MAVMSPLLLLAAQSFLFHALVNGQSTAASAQPTATSSGNSVSNTPDAIWFPLMGISDNPFLDWGANVSIVLPSLQADAISPEITQYRIAVNNSNPVTPELEATLSEGNPIPVVRDVGSTTQALGFLEAATTGDNALVLGLNSTLNLTSADQANIQMPTVPFGINLGHRSVWNGSVVLGGWYDANRVASTSWITVSETTGQNGTFLLNGTQVIVAELKSQTSSITTNVTIDINNDAFVLPSSFNCSEEFGILIESADNPDHALEMTVPTNITSSLLRCKTATAANATVILGRPFFQVAYAYLDTQGTMYLSAAHQYQVSIDAKPFDVNATLTPISAPPSNTQSPIVSNSAVSAWSASCISVGAVLVGAVVAITNLWT